MVDAISIAGSLLSFLGVIIAITQIRKTLRAAQAAKLSADKTQGTITRNVFMLDVSATTTAIEEVKALIRSKRYEATLLRVTDLNAQLIRLRNVRSEGADFSTIDFQRIVSQLTILRELLERRMHLDSLDINAARVNSVLSEISDQLNTWIGRNKYIVTEGVNNDK